MNIEQKKYEWCKQEKLRRSQQLRILLEAQKEIEVLRSQIRQLDDFIKEYENGKT